MFGIFKKKTDMPEDIKEYMIELTKQLKTMNNQIQSVARRLDRLNDTVVEHFEGVEDLGEITTQDISDNIIRINNREE